MATRARNLANLLGSGEDNIPASKLSDEISTIEQASSTDVLTNLGNAVGDQRLVGNNLYIWNGSGWFRIALINETPTWDSGGQPNTTYVLDSNQNPTVITLAATDPDGFPINYSYITGGQMDSMATISQDSSVFTITPIVQDSFNAGQEFTGSITFRASDGVNILPSISSFTLAFAGDWSNATQQTKLVPSTAGTLNRLGYCALSADGNTAIIAGSPANVFIFTRSGTTWSEQATINTSSGTFKSVDISADGNTVVIGNYTNESAYIYTRSGTTWSQQQILTASDGLSGDKFGISVSISDDGNTVVVGASTETTTQDDSGAAYIFTRSGTTWSEQQKIKGSDVNRPTNKGYQDYFGESVGISGDGNTIIVGAYWWDGDWAREGAAYIFTRSGSTWSEQTILFDDLALPDVRFGRSVHLTTDGNTAIVSTGDANGKVYIFTRSGTTWSQQQILTASDATNWDEFGKNISISGDGSVIIVGASEEGEDPSNAGAVYIFTKTNSTWTEVKKVNSSDQEASARFGWDVDISRDGQTAIAAAIYQTVGSNSQQGASYIFVPG